MDEKNPDIIPENPENTKKEERADGGFRRADRERKD